MKENVYVSEIIREIKGMLKMAKVSQPKLIVQSMPVIWVSIFLSSNSYTESNISTLYNLQCVMQSTYLFIFSFMTKVLFIAHVTHHLDKIIQISWGKF